MNSILVIHPYKHQGVWVLDDERVGLVREPFVAGAEHEFHWQLEESGGNGYDSPEFGPEGWLSPALLRYLAPAPQRLFVPVKPTSA
jgi:hypothetical protein